METVKAHALVLMPGGERVPLPCADLPELVIAVTDAVIVRMVVPVVVALDVFSFSARRLRNCPSSSTTTTPHHPKKQAHESVTAQETVAAWEEERRVSKYADGLEQLDTGRKISPNPADWRCDETGVTENLWLNLSTGHIGSGRQVRVDRWGERYDDVGLLAHVGDCFCVIVCGFNTIPLSTSSSTHTINRTGTGLAATARPCATLRPPGSATRSSSSSARSRRRVNKQNML
jgi:hypothetical protein